MRFTELYRTVTRGHGKGPPCSGPDAMAEVIIKNMKKVYGGKTTAVHDVNLHIKDKEFIVLVGPSGCGKSTTLRMVAGLEDITEGELYIDGKLCNDIAPKDRDIAMVFQNYALYPHMSVYDNMAFAMKMKKVPQDQIDKKVREVAKVLDITQYLERKPKALSGGQRQRVAIGRAMVRDPKVFLMDEPLSNLDAKLRNQMRAEIIKLRQSINTTFMYVTHDQTEAMTLGDRIVIMKDGYVNQIGAPQDLYNKPVNLFVAGFIGMPVMNFFDGSKLLLENGKYYAQIHNAKFELSEFQQKALKAEQPAALRHHRRHPPLPHPAGRGRAHREGGGLRDAGQRGQPAHRLRGRPRGHGHPHDEPGDRRQHGQDHPLHHPAQADPAVRQADPEQPDLVRRGLRQGQRAGLQGIQLLNFGFLNEGSKGVCPAVCNCPSLQPVLRRCLLR